MAIFEWKLIFQTPPGRVYVHLPKGITLWWTNIAIENGHL